MDNYLSRLLPRGIGNALRQFLSDSAPSGNLNAEWTPDATDNAKLGLGFTPMLGDAISGYDAYRAAQEGNYGEAALNAVGLLPFVPAMGGIVKPETAKKLKTVLNIPQDELFKSAVANTRGASITDDGLRMVIQRNQLPEQGMAESVRGGVFYLPEGAAQAKYYSTGKNGYGGGERISGETLIQNPLVAKGGTGGKAPESAYDSLLGKGAYQAMRSDALKAYGGYGASYGDKVSAARLFLEKYVPELSDQADYIVRNSGKGNQLAYGLQEAAVGSAVRNAGHDAVVGYSKGKSGPFLSEVFDVREQAYPDKFGGFRVWEDLYR